MNNNSLLHNIPHNIQKILLALKNFGHEAYIVGGAVRDLLLGRTPHDYDITTIALPEQVLALCREQGWYTVDKLGHNFGCVVIVLDGEPVEVTTFRGERYDNSDMHRPAATWFAKTLREDLARRDFTINAMAMDLQGQVYDYFGGQADLQRGILRTVGAADARYREDALRMLRACRFVAQLGFTYVQDDADSCDLGKFGMPGTPYELAQHYHFPVERCSGLSLERVRTEIEKLLLAPHAGRGLMLMRAAGLLGASCRVRQDGRDTEIAILPEAEHLLGLPQNPRFHLYDTWEHTLLALDNAPRELPLRWAMLLHDLGKGLPGVRIIRENGQPGDPGHEKVSAVMARDILTRFGYDKKFVTLVCWLVEQHMRFAPMLFTGERTLYRWVRAEATKNIFRNATELAQAYTMLVEVFLADMGATCARSDAKLMQDGRELGAQVVDIAKHHMPVANSDLAITGKDLLTLIPQEKIKATFAYLLNRVQNGNLPNTREALLEAVRKRTRREH